MALKADIVIVGGGVAGFAAAIAAAEHGKKVLLVEKSDTLGGNAVRANVGTICGAYYRCEAGQAPRLVNSAFLGKVVLDLLTLSPDLQPINYHQGLVALPYDWKVLESYMATELKVKGVGVMLNAEVASVMLAQNKIQQIEIAQGGSQLLIKSSAVVDTSGNGIVSQLAALEMVTSTSYQSASQVFSLENVASDNEFALNMALKKTVLKWLLPPVWPESLKSLSAVPGSLRNGNVDLKLVLPDEITDQTTDALSNKSKQIVERLFEVLKTKVASLSEAGLAHIAPQVGVRVQQRSKGKAVLSEEDVLLGKKQETDRVIGVWPIEEWKKDGTVDLSFVEGDGTYTIPSDCLVSYQVDNLFFAGKNISASNRAIGSARVMGTCLQTGYEAGRLASKFADSL
jgi:2-polyprenyl-6-methoxyphenol hydroxylase-like FAD-dependent oxidoreductase